MERKSRSFAAYFALRGFEVWGSTDVRWTVAPDLGHLDLFASSRHRKLLEEPILEWLRRVVEE